MDRYFIATERENPIFCDILETYEFAIFQWKEKVFQKLEKVLIEELLKHLKAEREGRKIDEKIVGCVSSNKFYIFTFIISCFFLTTTKLQVTKSFLELGAVKNDPFTLYEPFEEAFLKETKVFYKAHSRKLMLELNTVKSMTFDDFMNNVHSIFAHETDRVESYFDVSSVSKVISICEQCLIKDHLAMFLKAFEDYLENDYLEKFDQFYDLIKRFPDDIDSFVKIFKAHIRKEGDEAISKLDNVINVDIATYVEKIIAISEKYENLIKTNMENDEFFLIGLEDSMKIFVNENAATLASAFDDFNGEMLAKYCDKLLNKKFSLEYSEHVVERKLHHVWRIFKVLNDKDGFQKFYENITAQRLVFKLTVSENLERFMICKMRDYFGEQDSKSLRDIYESIKSSDELNETFRKAMANVRETRVLEDFSVSTFAERSCKYFYINCFF